MWVFALVTLTTIGLAGGIAAAQTKEGPVKLGVLTDISAAYSDMSGEGSVEAARLAIEDVGGKVLGQPVELVYADHQEKPDIGVTIARQWYERDGVDVILDVPNSTIALGVNKLAADNKKLAIYSTAGSDRITEEDCNGYGLHWTFDTYAETNAAVLALIAKGYDTWFLLVPDYTYGHALEQAIRGSVTSRGGKIVGTVFHPINTADFSSFLLQAQASQAKLVVTVAAGSDLINTLKQANEFGLAARGQHVTTLYTWSTEVHSLGLEQAQGMEFVEPTYWDLDERSRAFAKRFYAKRGKMPSEPQAGVYSATLQYLKAVEAAGSKDPQKVLEQLWNTPIEDAFARHGKLLPNGRMIHDMYLVRVKSPAESKYPWDYFEVTATIPAEQAFRPISESKCPLVKHS